MGIQTVCGLQSLQGKEYNMILPTISTSDNSSTMFVTFNYLMISSLSYLACCASYFMRVNVSSTN